MQLVWIIFFEVSLISLFKTGWLLAYSLTASKQARFFLGFAFPKLAVFFAAIEPSPSTAGRRLMWSSYILLLICVHYCWGYLLWIPTLLFTILLLLTTSSFYPRISLVNNISRFIHLNTLSTCLSLLFHCLFIWLRCEFCFWYPLLELSLYLLC